jgi:dihydrofolate synthase/folylpolyglutamate synthase
VTQYELLTAAAFLAFAEARVEWAVIEAGLGGRLDATNVIPSRLTVLTSVGLDHTEWLGDTVEQIAAEKLAVLRDHTTLVTGDLPDAAERVVEREVEQRKAERISVVERGHGYPAQNLALALAAASDALGRNAAHREPLDAGAADAPLVPTPGRAELVGRDPIQIFDAAHNPDGALALADLLPIMLRPFETEGRPLDVVCCLAVLAEKDAKGIVEALAPACAYFVCTEIPEEAIRGSGKPGGESHPASTLAGLCREAGAEAEAIADPLAAWARARELARERGAAALVAGSHYLLSSVWTERHAPSS